MSRIIFATGNADKMKEIRMILSDIGMEILSMKEAGIGYGAINHPLDRDPACGYTGVIGDRCPGCGRAEGDGPRFERIRRITGYLVGTLDRFNDAKKAEEHDRLPHVGR